MPSDSRSSSSTRATDPFRLARTCTCPTATPRWTSTATRSTAFGSTSPAGRRSGSSRASVARWPPWRCAGVAASRACNWRNGGQGRTGRRASSMADLDRERYAAIYGPTTGDQVRLGDTDLWIEVEDDLTFGGEEAVFGG